MTTKSWQFLTATRLAALILSGILLAGCQSVIVSKQERIDTQKRPDKERMEEPEGPKESTTGTGEKKGDSSNEVIVDRRPDSRGRPVRTFFSGSELIREKVIINGAPTVRISIRGGAVLRHNDVTISAPAIVLDGGVYGRCLGGVIIRDRKNGLLIRAKKADYNRSEQKLWLKGNPYMIIKKKKGEKPTVITARELSRDIGEGRSLMKGDVRIIKGGWTLLADDAVYRDREDDILVERDPIVLGNESYITGEKIRYAVDDQKMIMSNNVVFLSRSGPSGLNMITPGRPETLPDLEEFARRGGRYRGSQTGKETAQTDKKERVVSTITAQNLVYDFKSGREVRAEMTGEVSLVQDSMKLKSESLTAVGKEFHTIIAEKDVDLLERKQNLHITAGIMYYERKAGRIRLERSPRMEFLKKDSSEVQAVLTGATIEKDIQKKETVARGDVRLQREKMEVTGELATFHESAGMIVLEGDPGVIENNSMIRCERVFIFPEEDRILLSNRITGYVIER